MQPCAGPRGNSLRPAPSSCGPWNLNGGACARHAFDHAAHERPSFWAAREDDSSSDLELGGGRTRPIDAMGP